MKIYKIECSEEKKNTCVQILHGLAILNLIAWFFTGIFMRDMVNYHKGVILFICVFIGFVGSALTWSFSEIVKLLHQIRHGELIEIQTKTE